MIEIIKRLILFFKREKNWNDRTSDAPKAFCSFGETTAKEQGCRG
jgi:hypothetical protein